MNKQCNSDNVEDEQIKYILSVFFQICDNAINTTLDFPFVIVKRRIDVKTGHSAMEKIKQIKYAVIFFTGKKTFLYYLYRATLVDVSKKFCFAPLQSNPIATKSPLYSFIISLKSAYVMKSLFDNPTFYKD